MVYFKEITPDILDDVLNLEVFEHQKNFVSSNIYSLAQAWAYRKTAFPFAVYSDSTLVGFIMLGYYECKKQYTLWKFMIDKKYQHRGYGREALKLAIKYLISNFHVREIFTGVVFDNTNAKKLYSSLGFIETGEADEYQLEMKLTISG